jgi:hypothetical protein
MIGLNRQDFFYNPNQCFLVATAKSTAARIVPKTGIKTVQNILIKKANQFRGLFSFILAKVVKEPNNG